MKAHIILFFLINMVLQLKAQTFSDCSNNYHNAYNKIQLQLVLKQVDRKVFDSVTSEIDAILDSCIIGKEMPDYNLVGLSGKNYTNESLKGKVVVFNFWSVNWTLSWRDPCFKQNKSII